MINIDALIIATDVSDMSATTAIDAIIEAAHDARTVDCGVEDIFDATLAILVKMAPSLAKAINAHIDVYNNADVETGAMAGGYGMDAYREGYW